MKEVEESASLGRGVKEESGHGACRARVGQGLEQVLSGGGFAPRRRLVPVLVRQDALARFLQQVFILCGMNK